MKELFNERRINERMKKLKNELMKELNNERMN